MSPFSHPRKYFSLASPGCITSNYCAKDSARKPLAWATSASSPSSFLSSPNVLLSASVLGGIEGGKVAAWVWVSVHILFVWVVWGNISLHTQIAINASFEDGSEPEMQHLRSCAIPELFLLKWYGCALYVPRAAPLWCCPQSVMCRDSVSPCRSLRIRSSPALYRQGLGTFKPRCLKQGGRNCSSAVQRFDLLTFCSSTVFFSSWFFEIAFAGHFLEFRWVFFLLKRQR